MRHLSLNLTTKTLSVLSLLSVAMSLVALTLSLTHHFQSPMPVFAVVDTQSVIESQKVLWLRELNRLGQTKEAYASFLQESQRFPHKMQEALQVLSQKHNVILLNQGVLATQNTQDLTPELFALLGIEPQAASTARALLQRQTFGLSK